MPGHVGKQISHTASFLGLTPVWRQPPCRSLPHVQLPGTVHCTSASRHGGSLGLIWLGAWEETQKCPAYLLWACPNHCPWEWSGIGTMTSPRGPSYASQDREPIQGIAISGTSFQVTRAWSFLQLGSERADGLGVGRGGEMEVGASEGTSGRCCFLRFWFGQ